ncbi:hypothetical protein B0T16DRAFT_203462 [Cercophora newfieldiana]|uniref:UspA domain-containing protein n=1 Tax=Cercophora newfieldiana TaxID=92897 RepID=A0AA39XVH8_9PEZI|nr:hypothetical protein B0T16DRAFT_203462 [Cercophora newfieldiana]
MSKQAMSMEAMLDEERREVLALLEGQQRPKPPSSIDGRSSSPFTSPRSPVRSMLDIGDDSPSSALSPNPSSNPSTETVPPRLAPVRSMLDVDSPPPATAPIRSMLDVGDSPPPSTAKKVFSSPSSPVESTSRHGAGHGAHPRSMSDAASRPADFGPRSSGSRLDPTSNYQFGDILTNNTGNTKPKRVTQGGKRSSMAEVMRGNDVSSLMLPGDRGRHYSTGGNSLRLNAKDKSKSPHNRGLRSNSPANLLHGRQMSPGARAILADPLDIDYNNAYRRLSDAALARSGGSLSELGRRKKSDDMAGSGRLTKDYFSPDGDLLVEDSSEDNASSSEDEGERGRKAARSFGKPNQKGTSGGSSSPETTRTAKSMLAAAEEERLHVAAQHPTYQYRSLFDEPEIKITAPSGERVKQSKSGIHPATSFDLPPNSGTHTPIDSDTEADLTDIRRAQKLSFSMSQIIDTPESHRTIQIITRGEYSRLVQEAEDEHKRPRKYLVATDLSDESTHALEWAIGTVLRDGDTLLAIYCVDEETGIVPVDGESAVPDQSKAMKEQAAAISAMANSKTPVTPGGSTLPLHVRPSPLSQVSVSDSGSALNPSPAPSSRERSKATEERFRAVHDIGERVTKLLRKTRLQVKVIVEVLHCKNPRHLITEVIDLVDPTLVILGSRGRSALKG